MMFPIVPENLLHFGPVSLAMHIRRFGRIGFDDKGDVTGFEPWQWYVWQADGYYVPADGLGD
jgi:hypothetical protein